MHLLKLKYKKKYTLNPPPPWFGGADRLPKVLKLLQILYELKQAPNTFFDKLKAGLLKRNFIQSEIDMCLFTEGDLVYLVCDDGSILAGPKLDDINK